ncbi:formylglycine-generating enzyme required for sulfatase activity [Haloferula luteola]|uniref:Formylglycine-generating enzyme required for sulfatase activity n=1 Tax=Haloferula luteola TaxID=595692 RepID=A0A840VDK2_9BACT|nr:formylglycine-generating enzyme family protein [Haloferula luteola]MBB5350921.1 formylglycine-generating enzyme required for sulfatase activity [Haloferula luteola]
MMAIWPDWQGDLDWVELPPGEFQMGGRDEDKFSSAVELPRHCVRLSAGFALSRFPVTCGQWRAWAGELPAANAARVADDLPVVGVTWPEAQAFCRASGGRLPSEAEWEYACRAGSDGVFPQGAWLDPAQANYGYDEAGRKVGRGALCPVGSYPSNAFGLADMLGNVCEWTADGWHAHYEGAPRDGRAWTEGALPGRRVIRGGAWDHLPRVLRASWRDWAEEDARWDNLGFRVARDGS